MMESVKLIIERLKTHPEDFFGGLGDSQGLKVPRPKFGDLRNKIDDLMLDKANENLPRLWFLNEDEKTALLDAYKEARRARFEAQTFHTLLTPQEKDDGVALPIRSHPNTGKLLMQDEPVPMWQAIPKEEGMQIDTYLGTGESPKMTIGYEPSFILVKKRNTEGQ